jgi:hypothetical protein
LLLCENVLSLMLTFDDTFYENRRVDENSRRGEQLLKALEGFLSSFEGVNEVIRDEYRWKCMEEALNSYLSFSSVEKL